MLGCAVALYAALLWGCGAAAPPPPAAHCARLALDLPARARLAPTVLEARARSLSTDRRANLSVTFAVKRVLKADSSGRPLLEGEHVRVQVARDGCWGPPRPGRTYLLLAERAPPPAPPRLRLLLPPAPRSRHLTQKLRAVLRPRAVGRPPGVVGLRPQRVTAGSRVRLACQARGRPPPTLAWYRDGRPLLTTNRIRLQVKKRRSTLVISNARPEDSGIYECRAVEAGARPAISRANLTVQPDPSTDSAISGAPCPMADPSSYCLNGGTCLFFEAVREAACKCPEGFNGQRCENKDVSNRSSEDISPWSFDATSESLLQIRSFKRRI